MTLSKIEAEELSTPAAAKARAEAEAKAKKLWGPKAGAVEVEDLKERIEGRGCQVGIFRLVHVERRGFRPTDDAAFVALGRGRSWDEAFSDAERLKKKIEERLGFEGAREAERVYRLPLTKKA